MKQLTTAQSVQLIVRISEHLNTQIQLAGSIKPNNRNIWAGVLHELQNHHWYGMLKTCQTLLEDNRHIGEFKHRLAIDEGLEILEKYQHRYDRVLDIKNHRFNHKPVAWKCLMSIREVYCACIDLDLPNDDSSRETNTFKEIII